MAELNIYRCSWANGNSLMKTYHDKEWGMPVHDDRLHFEFMVLDAFQAGLSWLTVLNKRENFRFAFNNFDYNRVALYSDSDIKKLLSNEGIIRNKLKVEATINNAKRFIEIIAEYGSFDKYIWQFVGNNVIKNKRKTIKEIPSHSSESDAMSKALIKKGFRFAGTTICYSYMQAAGLVNDHEINCFRYDSLPDKII